MNNVWFVVAIVGSVLWYAVVWRLAKKAEADIYARGGPGGLYFYTIFFMPLVGLFAWWFARKRHARMDYIRASGRGRDR